MSRQNTVKAKLAALLKRTTENGFTEAEAMQAAATMRQILDRYGITMEELNLYRANANYDFMTSAAFQPEREIAHEVRYAGIAVSGFFDCKHGMMVSPLHGGRVSVFMGFKDDVDAAMMLFGILYEAMEASYEAWAKEFGPTVEDAYAVPVDLLRDSFMGGFNDRVAARLAAIKDANTPKSNALVVLKQQTVEEAMEAAGISAQKEEVEQPRNNFAYESGKVAADMVELAKSLDGASDEDHAEETV